MALRTGVPTIKKPAEHARKAAGLSTARKPVNRLVENPKNLRFLRTPGKQNDSLRSGTYIEQGLEDSPSSAVRTRTAAKAHTGMNIQGFAKKAARFFKAVTLYIKRLPRLLRKTKTGVSATGYTARSKAKRSINRRFVYIAAALIPAVALTIVLAATLSRGGSDTALAEAPKGSGPLPGGSAMLADVNNVIPAVPYPSSPASVSPAATPIVTTPPEPSAVNTTAPPETAKPSEKPAQTAVATTKPEPTPKPLNLNELVNYFKVDADKYYNDYHYSSNYYDYTEDDVHMLAQVITREAGHENAEGKLAVGNVVMNRVLCGYWGDTVQSVVTAGGQFSYDPATQPNSGSINAARDVLKNEHWVVPQDIYYFNSGNTPGENWGSHIYYTQIGGHCFYRESIGRRHKGGEAPPALFDREFKWPQYGCKPTKRVKRVQHMLRAIGYDVGQDGYFGKTTEEALAKFQSDKGLKSDGVAGSTTIKALIKAYGKDKYYDDYCK